MHHFFSLHIDLFLSLCYNNKKHFEGSSVTNLNTVNTDKSRVLYFDVLNILATLSVVFLHCNGTAHIYSNTLGWYQALFIEVFLYWPVPVFFMLTGATLMEYRSRYTTSQFFKKRFLRTVIPFVFWTLINAVLKGINPFEIGFGQFISRCFLTSVENVYWFFIPLFSVYLALPVLSLLKNHRRILWYLAGSTFLLTSLLPPVFKYIGLSWNTNLNMPMSAGYLLFVILGYLFSTEELSRKQRLVIYGFGIFGAVLRYTMTVILSVGDGVINKMFFSYTEYYSVFLAVAVFVMLRYMKPVNFLRDKKEVLSKISGCSFGVYLIHMIIIRFFNSILPETFFGAVWRMTAPVFIYLIALLITFVLKKIPIIKNIVP